MEKFEIALEKFISEWKEKDFVIAAILTGSYSTGNNTENSDIDVHIVLSDETTWRERGNKYIDGFLIEYFANPPVQIKKYMEDDYYSGIRTDSNMYINGKVLFDKTGIILRIKEEAKKYLDKQFEKPSQISIEFMKYHIYDEFENLKDNYDNESFEYYYYLYLDQLLFTYKNYLGAELPSKSKIYKFFTSKDFRFKYNLKEFPDNNFIKFYLDGIKTKSKSEQLNLISNLKDYILNKMGGFNIDGWKIHSDIEK